MQNIENIIFDLGGVLLNIDFKRTIFAFESMGIDDFQEKFSVLQQDDLFDDMDKGTVSAELFRRKIRDMLNRNVSDDEIDRAWNKLLLDFPSQNVTLLRELKKKYNLFLLSNTNEIHYEKYNGELKRDYNVPGLDLFFQKAYYSFKLGMRKPDPAIFHFVLKDSALDPSKTVFIDDSLANIESAASTGLKTIHKDPVEHLKTVLMDNDLLGEL